VALTWGNLKSQLRAIIFASGEAQNLVVAHDKSFLDAIIEIQTFVACQQQDNTNLYPHCSTLYNCGLTVIDSAPRGAIMKVSVIDKINPTTGLEDVNAADDYCSEIDYNQVDACHIHAYLKGSRRRGCCLSIPSFFGLNPSMCGKASYPVPTDAGLAAGLPLLPLGFHYAQDSTNRAHGRARAGIWALERGQLWVAPWIQSTETVKVMWDGIKRTWSDADPIDDDPLLSKAIKLYVQKEHSGEFDHEFAEEADYEGKWQKALAMLIHQCREETRVRECEVSHARSATVTNLYYNADQSASVSCGDGFTGSPVSVTIPAGSVGSSISVADANQQAQAQALAQAQAQLVCTAIAVTYTNDAQTATVSCGAGGEGSPVTVTVAAGTVSSTVSKADANTQALAQAQTQASAQLSCIFWNAAQTFTASCAAGSTGTPVTKTVAAHTYSSALSQADANQQALNAAKTQAENSLVCTGGTTGGTTFHNTQQQVTVTLQCRSYGGPTGIQQCPVVVQAIIAANTFTSVISQADANQQAINYASLIAHSYAASYCASGQCGAYTINFP
jgi:hypothetical protein